MINSDDLIAWALEARKNAFAAYSNFKVGAALRAASGRIYTGCNIENSTYGLTVCAERVALWKALSDGDQKFTQIAVVTSSKEPASPCGACRQLLWEFCGDIEIILGNLQGSKTTLRLSEIFPRPFDQHSL